MSQINAYTLLVLLQIGVIAIIDIPPITCAPFITMRQAKIYLTQFGYLPPTTRNAINGYLLDENASKKAIMDFQNFAGLRSTGNLDRRTMEFMSLPRCGIKDKNGFGTDSRLTIRPYAVQGNSWPQKHLTYRISKYTKKLTRQDVDSEIARAFNAWSEHTDLIFTAERAIPVDIDIRFEKYEHGDGYPFDGPSVVLAHAFFPSSGGDAHFDDSENWNIDSSAGIDLLRVAAHEFGHSLGLDHSQVQSALMFPTYQSHSVLRLDADDIERIQSLYGHKTASDSDGYGGFNTPPAYPPPNPANPPPSFPPQGIYFTNDGKIGIGIGYINFSFRLPWVKGGYKPWGYPPN